MSQIRITKGFLDKEKGRTVLRGILNPNSLFALLYGPYQRGLLRSYVINEMYNDLEAGASFPDMILGMRIGGSMIQHEEEFVLQGDVYNVDGRQRAKAYTMMVENGKGGDLHIGTKVFLDTTEEWERSAFCDY